MAPIFIALVALWLALFALSASTKALTKAENAEAYMRSSIREMGAALDAEAGDNSAFAGYTFYDEQGRVFYRDRDGGLVRVPQLDAKG